MVSPDGSKIAYSKWGDSPMIHIVDIDSGADGKVLYEGANEGDGWPTAWSPDGTQLVFTRWNGTENHLAIGSVDGGPVSRRGRASRTSPMVRPACSRRTGGRSLPATVRRPRRPGCSIRYRRQWAAARDRRSLIATWQRLALP